MPLLYILITDYLVYKNRLRKLRPDTFLPVPLFRNPEIVPVGKLSFTEQQLAENIDALMSAITKAKPSAAKGQYYRSVSISSTMGPGVKLNTARFI